MIKIILSLDVFFFLQFLHKQDVLLLPLVTGSLPQPCSPRPPNPPQHNSHRSEG